MILGKPIFPASSEIGLLFTIFRLLGTPKAKDYPEIPSLKDFSPSYPKFEAQGIHFDGAFKEAEGLVRGMLEINPLGRISVEEALRH